LFYTQFIAGDRNSKKKPNSGIIRPKGFVVIDRTNSLSKDECLKIKIRNRIFSGSLEIFTYDDLLKKADNMKKVLLSKV